MDEKKLVYEVIISIWEMFKKYGFEKLTDAQWESLIEDAEIKRKEFKEKGDQIELLFSVMFCCIENYYEGKGK